MTENQTGSLDGRRFDVVVVGGGFAGATVARDLTDQGKTVLLLEANDFLGGRAGTHTFPGTDLRVPIGGQFIDPPDMPQWMKEVERYGVDIDHIPEPQSIHTMINGARHEGALPLPFEQYVDLERAVVHLIRSAGRIQPGVPLDHQDLADLDVSCADFLAPLNLPPETLDLVAAYFSLWTFRPLDEGSALLVLTQLATMECCIYRAIAIVGDYIDPGLLVERMAEDVQEVRLGTPVASVDQTGDDVLVKTTAGETVSASRVVLAVPMNAWNTIEIAPQLSEAKRAASAEEHGCRRTSKAWLRVRNAPPFPAVIASPESNGGLIELSTMDQFDNGDQLMMMFGAASLEGDDYHLDFQERDSVERALQAMVPGAELVDFYSHSFGTDPYINGGHLAWKPGRVSTSQSLLSAPEGRIAFATADLGTKWHGAVEGAIESGHRAAEYTLNHLVSEREPAMADGS